MAIELRKFKSKRAFGVEMEVSNTVERNEIKKIINSLTEREIQVSGWQQTYNNKFWNVKTDSTCGPLGKGHDIGYEVTSFKAHGHKDLKEIGLVAEEMQKNGVVVNNNCGLHVHIEVKDFDVRQMAILVARWIKIENVLCNMVPERRVGNKHCRLISKTKKFRVSSEYEAKEFWDLIRPNNYAVNDNPQRKYTLNLVNYVYALYCENHYNKYDGVQYRKTIELRMPEGTLDPNDIKSWVRLMICFVETAKNAKMPENLKSISTMSDFFRAIGLERTSVPLSPGLQKTKLWILERVKKFGSGKLKTQASAMLKRELEGKVDIELEENDLNGLMDSILIDGKSEILNTKFSDKLAG